MFAQYNRTYIKWSSVGGTTISILMLIFTEDETETNFESKKPMSLKEARYEEACNRLAVEAVKRGCTDNVTVMLIDITQQNSTEKERK